MNVKQLFVLVLTLLTFLSTRAEVGVSVGARAGFTIAHLRKYTPPENFTKRVNLGSDLAAVLRVDFNEHISLQTEVEFVQKGQGWKRSQDSARYSGKLVTNYVQFPIMAVGRVGSEKIKAIFLLGPYFGYWVGGYSQEAVSVDKQSKQAATSKYEFTASDNRFDVGMVSAVGADFKVGKGWIELMARHNLGFMSITDKDSGLPKQYPCNFALSVGYRHQLK